MFLRFWIDEDGTTAIEYCLIAGVLAIAVITSWTTIGTRLSNHYFQPIGNSLS